jgi:5-hydroxyisourate hydrolase
MKSPITTHVLDVGRGRPAAGVPVKLERLLPHGGWEPLGQGETDQDGRASRLLPAGYPLEKGSYRLLFDTAAYWSALKSRGFYPSVAVVFLVESESEHYHVPLLLSPFGYSTYRGS